MKLAEIETKSWSRKVKNRKYGEFCTTLIIQTNKDAQVIANKINASLCSLHTCKLSTQMQKKNSLNYIILNYKYCFSAFIIQHS